MERRISRRDFARRLATWPSYSSAPSLLVLAGRQFRSIVVLLLLAAAAQQ